MILYLKYFDNEIDRSCVKKTDFKKNYTQTLFLRDGALLSGVFCAMLNFAQQIKMDDSVDVFTTVRQLQTRRQEFCSTLVSTHY